MKTFKILNANKQVRKKFNSIEEAHSHIKEKNLYQANKNCPIRIEETCTTYHEVKIKPPTLDEEVKNNVLNILRENINDIEGNFIEPSMLYSYYIHKHIPYNEYYEFAKDIVKEHFSLSEEEIKDIYSQYYWNHGGNNQYDGLIMHEDFQNLYKEKILNFLLEKNIKYYYIQTDYIPCNNIAVQSCGNVFQIRKGNIIFGTGFIHGRNVNVRQKHDLNNKNYSNFIKETVWLKK